MPRIRKHPARKCRHCQKRFRPLIHPGPTPVYCSRNCRQRAYEARKDANTLPLKLLKSDLNTIGSQQHIRDLICDELRKAGIILPPDPPQIKNRKHRPSLRRVK